MVNSLANDQNTKAAQRAQSTVEFVFGFIVLSILVYALVQAFRWNMMNFAEQRVDHDRTMVLTEDFSTPGVGLYNYMTVKYKKSFLGIGGGNQCDAFFPKDRGMSHPDYDVCWDDTFDPEEQLNSGFHQQRKLDLIPLWSGQ